MFKLARYKVRLDLTLLLDPKCLSVFSHNEAIDIDLPKGNKKFAESEKSYIKEIVYSTTSLLDGGDWKMNKIKAVFPTNVFVLRQPK